MFSHVCVCVCVCHRYTPLHTLFSLNANNHPSPFILSGVRCALFSLISCLYVISLSLSLFFFFFFFLKYHIFTHQNPFIDSKRNHRRKTEDAANVWSRYDNVFPYSIRRKQPMKHPINQVRTIPNGRTSSTMIGNQNIMKRHMNRVSVVRYLEGKKVGE